MRSISKKSLSVILAVIMAFSLVISAAAGSVKNITSSRNDDGTETITGYHDVYNSNFAEIFDKENGMLTIADSLKSGSSVLKFTGVAEEAFAYDSEDTEKAYLSEVRKIIVNPGVKYIGAAAFSNLPNLEKVTFRGDTVLSERAFADCAALTTVVFEKDADIGKDAFAGCFGLKTFTVNNDAYITAYKGALEDTAYYAGFDVDFITLGSTLIRYKGTDEFVTIPLNITVIGSGAFENNNTVKKIKITNFVNTLCDFAFRNCRNLKEVIYSNYGEITKAGKDVFSGTPYYNNFDGDFFTIGTYLIKYKGKDAYVSIPNTITAIAPDCFNGCFETTDNGRHTYVVSAIYVSASVRTFGANCFGLDELEDGTYYTPRIYAYSGSATESMRLLREAGYNPTVMPAPADVDADGKISAADARKALRISVKLDVDIENIVYRSADINGDKRVTADDARTILRLSVGLESYNAEDLLYMPATDFEILQAYTESMKNIAKYTAGYTKNIINTPGEKDATTKANFTMIRDVLAKQGYENSTNVYKADTTAALKNIDFCELVSTKNIKDASCVLDVDDNYVITIKFRNIKDNSATSDIMKVFPAQTRNFYAEKFMQEYWWNGSQFNKINKFDLTYTGASVTAVVDKETLKPISTELALGYHFEMAGKIDGITISSEKDSSKPATFDRLDIVKYSDFVF